MNLLGSALLTLAMQALPLQGIVIKKGTNEPLSKATVELRRDQENAGILDKLTTEDDGRFRFDNVAPGRYRLTVTRRGYVRSPLAITVATGQARAEIELPMTQAGAISGRVHDANGQPVGNVEILAMKASYPEGRRILTPVQSAVTNDLGEYRLFSLPPGRYYVSAVHPKAQGMLRRMANVIGISVSVSTTSAVGTFHSAAKSDPAVGGFEPEPESESERYAPVFFGGTTDEQSASSIDIRAGSEVSGANIMIAPVRARHVRGIVIDGVTGRPAQYASLDMSKDLDLPGVKKPEVDREKATFDLLLLPGSYTVNATSASGEGSITFQVADVDIENLTIATTPVFNIAGRIAFDGEPASGESLGALRITLRRDPPREEPRSSFLSYSTPLPNGSFTISASAGDYRPRMPVELSSFAY